jgi:hypothetical protein
MTCGKEQINCAPEDDSIRVETCLAFKEYNVGDFNFMVIFTNIL